MQKTYIGISLDRSGSMSSIRNATVKAYNGVITAIRDAAISEGQDTILYANTFGNDVRWLLRNSSAAVLNKLDARDYSPDGGTPMFQAMLEIIQELMKVPDYNDPNVAFQLTVVTDGAENTSSPMAVRQVSNLIPQLSISGKWTFSFLVPRGHSNVLSRFGIPRGNIREWDATVRGTEEAFQATAQAYTGYLRSRSAGVMHTSKFFTDVADVKVADLKKVCTDIRSDVKVFAAKADEEIKDFCEKKTKKTFLKGAAFYELTKTEKAVQDYKKIAIVDKKTGAIYAGDGARQMLGLPASGSVRLAPGDQGQYDIFIQSTSVNRKVPAGTRVLYWEGAV